MADGQTNIEEVWVTEARALTALGDLDETWNAILQGKSGIRKVAHFDTAGLACNLAASINGLPAPCDGASRLHPILDSVLGPSFNVPQNPLVITATIKAGIDNLETISRGKKADAGDILPSQLPAIVAKKLGIELTRGFNVNAACTSGSAAIARAASMIRSGLVDCAAVCCVEPLSLFIFSGFASLRILSERPCRPFDRNRDGLTIGEGAAAFVLMRANRAREMGCSCLGVIKGWAMTNDAEHITTPDPSARGLIKAIRSALACASTEADKIAAVGAHGTGTVYNDATELLAISEVFGPSDVPVYSVKGSLGHAMGAAGGIEAAIALKALSRNVAPPTVGLRDPEENPPVRVVIEPTNFEGNRMLTMNSGFGGVNCALVIEAGKG
jgi:3-oxoacyl-[acyl-carrier-protein] synthase II